MGALNRLDRLDRVVMGVNRWKRKLRQPEDPAALAVWDELSEEQRDAALEATPWGQTYPEHPGVALVTADFQLQAMSELIRGIVWTWLAAAGLVMMLVVLSIWWGSGVLPALVFLAPLVAVSIQLWKVDRGRKENLRIAREAGLR